MWKTLLLFHLECYNGATRNKMAPRAAEPFNHAEGDVRSPRNETHTAARCRYGSLNSITNRHFFFQVKWQWSSVGPLRGPEWAVGGVRRFLAPLGLRHRRLRQNWTAPPPLRTIFLKYRNERAVIWNAKEGALIKNYCCLLKSLNKL